MDRHRSARIRAHVFAAFVPLFPFAQQEPTASAAPVIERVDEYSNIENVDFLKQLQKEGLFAAEVNDGG